MAISQIVCRGFGAFGGGVHKLPTRGYTPKLVSSQSPQMAFRQTIMFNSEIYNPQALGPDFETPQAIGPTFSQPQAT